MGGEEAYRGTSTIKSLSSVCVNMSWLDDFISRYLFVSWSTPPIINGPPCILRHAEFCVCVGVCVSLSLVCARETERERDGKIRLVCDPAVAWKHFQSYMRFYTTRTTAAKLSNLTLSGQDIEESSKDPSSLLKDPTAMQVIKLGFLPRFGRENPPSKTCSRSRDCNSQSGCTRRCFPFA